MLVFNGERSGKSNSAHNLVTGSGQVAVVIDRVWMVATDFHLPTKDRAAGLL